MNRQSLYTTHKQGDREIMAFNYRLSDISYLLILRYIFFCFFCGGKQKSFMWLLREGAKAP